MLRFTHCIVASMFAGLVCVGMGCESQRQFESPESALAALTAAAENADKPEIRAIFGPRANELRSDDIDQDKQDIQSFRRSLLESCKVEKLDEDTAILLVGEHQWPFAVPLVREGDRWIFDTDAGIEELDNRRIGRNELRTMAACKTVVDAQIEYHSADRDGDGVLEYADRLMSSEGKRDGLYWPSPGGVDPSPIGPVFAEAAIRVDDQGERIPFNGYRFRPLTRQGAGAPGGAMDYRSGDNLTGGWALIAWPAEYDHTGVMSFLIGHGGVLYQADLGPDTANVVAGITEFDPSTNWTPVSP